MRHVLCILKKEAIEMGRDKRVINAAFIGPIFMIVLFIFLFGYVTQKVGDRSQIPIAVIGGGDGAVSDELLKSDSSKVTYVETLSDGLALMEKGDVNAVVEFSGGPTGSFVAGEAVVSVHFDSGETLSSIALSAVRKAIEEFNKQSATEALVQNGLPKELAEPIRFEAVDEKRSEGLGGSLIVGLIPYLIVLWAFYGGFSAVSDLVAGEKERGTMETLLVSPVTRKHAALGKFFALAFLCLTSSLTTLVGVVIVGAINLPLTRELFPTGMHVSAVAAMEGVLILVPLALFFAGVLVSVSAYAKNVREAQTFLTLVSFLVILPAVFSQFIQLTGVQNATWVSWTPILNAAVSLRFALLGTLEPQQLIATVFTSLVLAGVSVTVTVRLFSDEKILTRT